MPRSPRLEAPDAIHHVTARSTGMLQVFGDTASCRTFLDLLAHEVDRCGRALYAFCLMPNHFHMLLRTPQPNLGEGMRALQGVVAQRFNRAAGRLCAVWGERFHSKIVEQEAHGVLTAAHVVLNPVRAGLARDPAAWPWSSYRATAGIDPAPPFLAARDILCWIDVDVARAQRRYRSWIEGAARDVAALPRGWSPTGTVPNETRGRVPVGR